MVSLDYGVTASHRRHSAGCPYLLFIRGYDHHIRSPALARQCSFCLRIRPPRAVRRLDCLDPGGVIKWRASERVSLVRQRSWNFATRDSRAPQLACWTAGRPLRRRRPSPSRSFDEFLQGYSNGRTNYRGTALHCRNGVDGPLGGPMQLGFF